MSKEKAKDSGYLFMVYRMEKQGSVISWVRHGRPMKDLKAAIRLCTKQKYQSYVEVYPGRQIVFDKIEVR